MVAVGAFAPTSTNTAIRSSSTLRMANFDTEIGAQAPLGFWDPIGLLVDADQARFDRLRYVETKHGRIAMLAILGHIVTTKGDRFPGEIAYGIPFASVKSGLAAFQSIPLAGIAQLFFFIGLLELGFDTVQRDIEEGCKKEMTNRGWNEAVQRNKAAIELNNGRAAQMGILGLMVHEKLNNDPYVLNSLLGMPVPFNQ
eukprot:CAMPEP_0119033690 /NCGR_PEP_ID=MMETSP1177-20130426/747_1 /TAXON_ID=2985 /ORGANISM="Ochromonas sp, Strain CCMP1899" /LENGTH=197 /DNA_ID=CAMNT_0006990629 /DNA_START=117 /DNA_END=710 /DNA_ORIENTATION=+